MNSVFILSNKLVNLVFKIFLKIYKKIKFCMRLPNGNIARRIFGQYSETISVNRKKKLVLMQIVVTLRM